VRCTHPTPAPVYGWVKQARPGVLEAHKRQHSSFKRRSLRCGKAGLQEGFRVGGVPAMRSACRLSPRGQSCW
jgi:hypothetical protein